jgi:argininosuccinate lyase
MRAAASDETLFATDLAEALVRGGVPFREANHRVGATLKALASEDRVLRDLTPEEWEALGVPDGASLLDPDVSLGARSSAGGPAPAMVAVQADALEAAMWARREG